MGFCELTKDHLYAVLSPTRNLHDATVLQRKGKECIQVMHGYEVTFTPSVGTQCNSRQQKARCSFVYIAE